MQIRFNAENNFSAVDMSSKHGVLINGVKITDEVKLNDNDYITVGTTSLMFTLKDFDSRENALLHYKKIGQRNLPTITLNK
jgi:pSer/pThr/pTyr-binding forkhead associated (FHA) protein